MGRNLDSGLIPVVLILTVFLSIVFVPYGRATPGVEVLIEPIENEALPGENLQYIVTITNTGTENDNYDLTVSDNENWDPTLDNYRFENIPENENRTTILRVHIPENAIGCTRDNITVTATSQADNTVSGNNCIAHVKIVENVEVSISPSPPDYLENENGENVYFTVTVINKGNIPENYKLEKGDNAGWSLDLVENLYVRENENATTTLTVTIPSDENGCNWDSIWAAAISENEIKDNASCIAHVRVARGVVVNIEPDSQPGVINKGAIFTVTVKNTGNVWDNYKLENNDVAGWALKLDNDYLEIPKNENRGTKLTVFVPDNENLVCTTDNITVVATAVDNAQVTDNDNCSLHAVKLGVEVLIEPIENEALPGENLTYTVTVVNTGGLDDNYNLTVGDNAAPSWNPVLDNTLLMVPENENRGTTLRVTIPENAFGCTRDNITVTAISQADNTIENSANCIAHAYVVRGVEVSISPSYQTGSPGGLLTYDVRVKNLGNIPDNYSLTVDDNAGWGPTVLPTSLVVLPGENEVAALEVTAPPTATNCTRDNIRVVATSVENASIGDFASCEAHVLIPIEVSISPNSKSGLPGENVTFTVTVTNSGPVDDNYTLNPTSITGWTPRIEPASLALAAGASGEAILSITIPSDVRKNILVPIDVDVRSTVDPGVFSIGKCTVSVVGTGEEEKIYLLVLFAILVIIGAIIGAIFAAKHLRKIKRGRPRRTLRRQAKS